MTKEVKNADIKDYQETNVITKVETSPDSDYYTISMGAMCFGLEKKHGIEPQVGKKLPFIPKVEVLVLLEV